MIFEKIPKRFAALVILLLCQEVIFCADSYSVGDTLYVWAKSGLNVRKGPGINFEIIEVSKFGDLVLVEEKTNKEFNVIGVKDVTYRNDAQQNNVIFYGKWVKIKSTNGHIGYVIDQYLLSLIPDLNGNPSIHYFPLKLEKVDTTFKSEHFTDGEGLNYKVEHLYIHDIKVSVEQGGVWSSEYYEFPQLTIEEVLILLSFNNNEFEEYQVERNWPEELFLSFEGGCNYKITRNSGLVIVKTMCSC